LSVHDSLVAAGNRVAGELDALAGVTAALFYVEHLAGLVGVRAGVEGRGRLGSKRRHEHWLQVAVLPWPAISQGWMIATSPWASRGPLGLQLGKGEARRADGLEPADVD
jgi:hypothetical protein